MSTANPFLVSVHALRRDPGAPKHEHRAGRLPGLRVSGSSVPDDAEVTIDATLEHADGGIVVTATVDAPWVGDCRRCLEPAHGTVQGEMRELYERGSDGEETYPYEGDQLDLAPLARDAVLLELPQAPLCQEDCQGLCPECGANRNEGDCGHADVPTDPRWAALEALRTQDS